MKEEMDYFGAAGLSALLLGILAYAIWHTRERAPAAAKPLQPARN